MLKIVKGYTFSDMWIAYIAISPGVRNTKKFVMVSDDSLISRWPCPSMKYVIHNSLTLWLTHWGWDKMTAILQMTFLKCIFLNENVSIFIKIALKFMPKVPINNIPTLFQIMPWHRAGNKPLSEPMMVSLLMHISVGRSQWIITYVGCEGKISWLTLNYVPYSHFKLWSYMQCSTIVMQSIFSKIFKKDNPKLARQGEVWGVFWGSSLGLIFCLSSCNDVCNIMLY